LSKTFHLSTKYALGLTIFVLNKTLSNFMVSPLSNLRNFATNIIKSFFQKMGLYLQYYNPSNSETALISYLLNKYDIKTIIDIGANEGQFALKLINNNNYSNKIISFEPVSSAYQALLKNSKIKQEWIAINSAVGDIEGTLPINVSLNSVSSSLRKVKSHTIEAESGTAILKTETVPINTLDNLLKQVKWEKDIWLKIDVQGFEREVIRGANETLKIARVVQIELAVIPSYEQSPYLEEIIAELRTFGFTLYSIMSGFRNYDTGQMFEVEGFFIREYDKH